MRDFYPACQGHHLKNGHVTGITGPGVCQLPGAGSDTEAQAAGPTVVPLMESLHCTGAPAALTVPRPHREYS